MLVIERKVLCLQNDAFPRAPKEVQLVVTGSMTFAKLYATHRISLKFSAFRSQHLALIPPNHIMHYPFLSRHASCLEVQWLENKLE